MGFAGPPGIYLASILGSWVNLYLNFIRRDGDNGRSQKLLESMSHSSSSVALFSRDSVN